MNRKLKLLRRIVSLTLAGLLFINPLVVPVVYAEGEEITPTPTPEAIVSPVPEASPSPAPSDPPPSDPSILVEATPTPQSTITTGDADSSSVTNTTVNNNTNNIDGSLAIPTGSCSPPEGQTNCPDNIGIGNSNQAVVSGSVDSSANTGENQESGSAGGALIDTGDATASGEIINNVNENTVILETTPTPSSSSDSLSGSPNPSIFSDPSSEKTLSVNNENDASVQNNADILAKTGENIASENLGGVDLKTGDALAWLNMLNLLNTNVVGSNFEILFLDIREEDEEINLNELWKLLQEKNGTNSLELAGGDDLNNLHLIIRNLNEADLENKVNVCAISGGNEANSNSNVDVGTGNATALANVANIINTNIVGAKFFFGVINILGSFSGNLILPRPELFMGIGNSGSGTGVVFENNNFADINNGVQTSAATGGNQADNNSGDNAITTGKAVASTNTYSLANLNISLNDWFYLLLNNLGDWEGKVYGWSNPGVVEENSGGTQAFQSYSNGAQSGTPTPMMEFQNDNSARLTNDINVSASTGGNRANENRGSTAVKTGDAKAFANLINLVNVNILGGRWFMGLVNVLGRWSGNTIFAYPDLAVNLSGSPEEAFPGDSFEYALNFKNQGYEEAERVSIKMEFPQGVNYEGDDSGMTANCVWGECIWRIEHLGRAQSGAFKVKVKIDPNFLSLGGNISFLNKLVPKVYAAEENSSFVVKASVTTIIPESDDNNNVSERLTVVKEPAVGGVDLGSGGNQENGVDQRQPVLEISVWNNVGEFVYSGDTITYEITVWNKSDVASENTYLTQVLYNGVPEDFGKINIKIGKIEAGKKAKVTFGMMLVRDKITHAGSYYSISKAYGTAPNGNIVSSNETRAEFNVKIKEIASFFEVKAVENIEYEGEMLGVAEEKCPKEKDKGLPYGLLFVLSSLWIVERSRKLSEILFDKNGRK